MADEKTFWNRFAGLYGTLQVRKNRELYETLNERISSYLEKDMKVLELACGTGEMGEALCERVSSWTATDFSENMIREARKKSSGRVTYRVEDATEMSFPDESFDLVIIANALHVMPDPDKALSEIRRVLKRGGMLIAPTFVYEGKINRFRLKVMKMAGFVTYHEWTHLSLQSYLAERGWKTVENTLIPTSLLTECFIAAGRV